MNENKTNINWYPGHMAKTKREIKEMLSLIDIVICVVDARIPKSSFIPDLNEFTKNKEKIIVMSKYDLCDKEKTKEWKKYYEDLGYKVVLSSIYDKDLKKKILSLVNESMKSINLKRKEKGLLAKKARVIVVGVSNVGKSSLINKLVGKNVAKSGNMPGVTRSISTIKIDKDIDLIDTPGVLWPKFRNEEVALNLASMTIIRETLISTDDIAIHILSKLDLLYKDKLKEFFGIDSFDKNDLESAYEAIAKFKNFPPVCGEVDYDRINALVIGLIKKGKLKEITFD